MPFLQLIKRSAIAAVVVVLILTAAEGVGSFVMLALEARALEPPRANFRQAVHDTLIGWVPIPNLAIRDNFGPGIALHTNADGVRIHRPVTPALAPSERRIVCSGDSFTFGSGVGDAETFCARLETELPGVQTLNMAQRGYGNDQMYLRYRRDAARYPHQVHLFAFIWNDFERMASTSFLGYSKSMVILRDGQLATENVPVPPWEGWRRRTMLTSLVPRSRLMQLVHEHLDLSDSTSVARTDAKVWEPSTAIFRDLARIGRERASTLVLVYLPTVSDVTEDAYRTRREKLAAFSKESGIHLVDLTDEMRRLPADSAQWLFLSSNQIPVSGSGGHYSPQGHTWVAQRLREHLLSYPDVAAALGSTTRVATRTKTAP